MISRYKAFFNETVKAISTMVDKINATQGEGTINVKQAEDFWKKATELAKKQGHEKEYDYIMGIWKNMTGYEKPRKKPVKTTSKNK